MVGVVAAAALLAVALWLFGRRPVDPHPDLVVCMIDDASLEKHSPWSKAQLAKLLEALGMAGARAVAIPFASFEGSAGSGGPDDSWEDEALAAALESFGHAVVAYPASLSPGADPIAESGSAASGSRPRISGDADKLELPSAAPRERRSEVIHQAAWGQGFLPDSGDGSTALLAWEGGRLVPSFALAALAAFEDRPPRLSSGGRRLEVGPTSVALDRRGRIEAPALRLGAGQATISAAEVLAGRGAVVAGRLVLVGFSATAESDLDQEPLPAAGPFSLEREAALLSWLLGGARDARKRLGVGLAALLGLLAVPLALGLMSLGFGGKKRRRQEEIRRVFEGRLRPQDLGPWLERPEEAPTAFARRQATVLAAEIGGFMELAEALAPDRLSDSLARSLDGLRERVFEQGGVVEHLDALGLRAMFGAPLPAEDHARRACGAALELRRALLAERGSLAALYELPLARVPLTLEIGVASGAVVAGAIPQPGPGGYSALGPPVVTATRLARLGRGYGTAILLSEAAAEAAGDGFLVRELDRVRVRGLAQALTLYELVTVQPAAPADRQRTVRYQAGLAAYRNREFVKAERLFASILEDLGEDGAARVMAERCRRFRAAAPPEGWDGTASIANV